MIMPYDPDYLETKLIMLGQASMKTEFKLLADWVDKTFGVKTINIVYDTIDNGTRPRLELCFEFEKEKNDFQNGNAFGFDRNKQNEIGQKFKEIIEEQRMSDRYMTENIWVIYGGFEPIACIEANQNIPQENIDQLQAEINNPDLWMIRKAFSGVIFFLYTDKQLEQYKNTTVQKDWADQYFDKLEPYNQFGYFKRDKFRIELDSKENFDTNYQSNWYYYMK